MSTEQMGTYEKIYFALWELGQRYGNFVQFRVIGRSHDDRMIPMLEIGKGDTCIICLSGVESGDRNLPEYLLSIAKDYCRSYESNWTIGESYEVRKLLDKVRICMIPMLNPDSYEICEYGYGAIHNPIHRQMLKMQDRPVEEYECNARGIDLRRNFPTNYYQRKRVNQEPASENETRALISISGIFKPWPAYIQLFQREDRLLQTGERLCLQSEKLQTGKAFTEMFRLSSGKRDCRWCESQKSRSKT